MILSRKAPNRSATSPRDCDLRRLHTFGDSVQMWVSNVQKNDPVMTVDDCTRPVRASRCGSWHCVPWVPKDVRSVRI